jgi:hypothetical protein
MRFNIYRLTREIGRGRIAELVSGLGLDFEAISALYDQRLFDPTRDT